jgi:4-amino-4-deoxy-L-arabinose transferase-like glycosyltransferase
MENDKQVTGFFLGVVCFAIVVTTLTSMAEESWVPVVVLGCVLLGLLALSVFWAVLYIPLFTIMGRIIRVKGKQNRELTR